MLFIKFFITVNKMKKNIFLVVAFFTLQFCFGQTNYDSGISDPFDYDTVEVRPEFPGGFNQLMTFIGKNFNLPEYDGPTGIVKVSFVIEKNGSLSSIRIVKDLGEGSGAEAKRVIALSPLWSPGQQDGKPVRVKYELPISIRN